MKKDFEKGVNYSEEVKQLVTPALDADYYCSIEFYNFLDVEVGLIKFSNVPFEISWTSIGDHMLNMGFPFR